MMTPSTAQSPRIREPFAIQARALPDALAGRDVLGRAQTGSGKTLAFGLALLTRLAATRGQRREKAPRGLVLVTGTTGSRSGSSLNLSSSRKAAPGRRMPRHKERSDVME